MLTTTHKWWVFLLTDQWENDHPELLSDSVIWFIKNHRLNQERDFHSKDSVVIVFFTHRLYCTHQQDLRVFIGLFFCIHSTSHKHQACYSGNMVWLFSVHNLKHSGLKAFRFLFFFFFDWIQKISAYKCILVYCILVYVVCE